MTELNAITESQSSYTYENISIKIENWDDNTVWFDDVNLSSSDTSEEVTFLYPDHLGRPVSANFDYLPFGAIYQGTPETNLRFSGQYADRTDLFQNGFRDYNPRLGRYIEPDPIGQLSDVNLYAYVLNNPVYLTDPFGLYTWPYTWKGWAGLLFTGSGGLTLAAPFPGARPIGFTMMGTGTILGVWDLVEGFNQAEKFAKETGKNLLKKRIKNSPFSAKKLQKMGLIPSNRQLEAGGLSTQDLKELGLIDNSCQ